MRDAVSYHGATAGELRSASGGRRLLGLHDQGLLFPHRGGFWLEPDALVLEGWLNLPRSQITAARLEFTRLYSRFTAAGFRGRQPSFGLLGSLGKPLILERADGDPLYLLLDFRWGTGVNQNRRWHPQILRWLRGASAHA